MPRSIDRAARLDDIADAVEAIARRSGFGAVTFRDIAAQLGSSTTVITHLFASRDDLLGHVIDRSIAKRRADIEADLGDSIGAPALRVIAERAVLGFDDNTHRLWLALVTGAASEPIVRARLDTFNQWWDELLDAHAELLPATPDPGSIADALNVIVTGLVVSGVETNTVWPPERRRTTLDRLLAPLNI